MGMVSTKERISCDRPRPPRARPVEPAVGRQRSGHVRRRPRGAHRGTRGGEDRAAGTFEGLSRRASRPLQHPQDQVNSDVLEFLKA